MEDRSHDDASGSGEPDSFEELSQTLYEALKRQARRARRRNNPGETLSTTAVVHEAYLRLRGRVGSEWNDRNHFLAAGAKAMRSVVVDYLRRHLAVKRGKGVPALHFDESIALLDRADLDIIALDTALKKFEAQDPRRAEVVELRFWGGLTIPEISEVVGRSVATVERDWTFAKAWLSRELNLERSRSSERGASTGTPANPT